ncbi:MAG: folylpolyglutamate synthase/dihydrofolate synthase family protein [Candidatus Thermoplasmatota archaeon]
MGDKSEETAARSIENPRKEFEHPEEYFYSLKRVGVKLGLDKIEDFLSRLENPHEDFESILVGGTNAKGSVCTALMNILDEAGYNTGLYTSPHLTHFEERMQVNGEKIKEEELWPLIEEVHPEIKKIEKEDPEKRPSFFEVLTAVAFLYFSRQEVDIAVLEVGMGGRLDATNVAPHAFSVVTYVGYDHAEYLGDTKKKIAREKAGIIGENNYFVTGETDREIRDYFKSVCRDKRAEFNYAFDREHEILFDPLRLRTEPYGEIKVQGIVPWLAENVLMSLETAEGLQKEGYDVTERNIKKGIEKTVFPGKMETVKEEPRVIMDSAHNRTGFEALARGLERLDFNRLLSVVGVLEDKDHESMVEILGPITDKAYPAEPVSERRLDSEKLAEDFREYCPAESSDHGIEALRRAEDEWKQGDLIVITGSLYLLGDIRRKIEEDGGYRDG